MIPMSRLTFGREEESAVLDVMRSGQFAQGERVREFERAFASATGAEFAVAKFAESPTNAVWPFKSELLSPRTAPL